MTSTNLRITCGTLKGRRLKCKLSEEVRPTSEKVRQAVYNMLGNNLTGIRLLDLCGGSGIMCFEAISRNAEEVILIEQSPSIIKTLRKNMDHLGISPEKLKIFCDPFQRAIPRLKGQKFEVIYFDPPYVKEKEQPPEEKDLYLSCGKLVIENSLLSPKGVLITEHFKMNPVDISSFGYNLVDERIFGTIGLQFWKVKHS